MREEEKINPEDYWSDAEQLLDNHFQAKKRRRLLLLLFLLLGSSAGIGSYIYFGGDSDKVTEVPATKVFSGKVITLEDAASSSVDENATPSEEKVSMISAESNVVESSELPNRPVKRITHAPLTDNKNITVMPELTEHNTIEEVKSSSKSENTLSLSNLHWSELLSLAPMNGYPSFPSFNADEIKINASPEKKKIKSKWDIFLYGGAGTVSKDLNGSPVNYVNRRNSEERTITLPEAGFQFGKSFGDFDIRGGLALSIIGEQVNYSPYSRGEYYGSSQQWQHYQYAVTDTDSTYILGMLFLNTQIVQRTDSVLTDVVDTLNGLHYNEMITIHNGKNRRYIMELPLTVTYQLSRSRFGIGVFAGMAPGVVIRSKGYYLLSDESDVAGYSKSKQHYTFNVQGGVEFSYLANEYLRIVLRPITKLYLTGITEVNGGSSKYRSSGIQFGVIKNIR